MARVRRAGLLTMLTLVLAACGGGSSATRTTSSKPRKTWPPASFAGASAHTVAAGSARFTLSEAGFIAGVHVRTDENGTVSFNQPRAHVYVLDYQGGGLPQELVVDGPFTYTNDDVQAAMNDPTVKPWTKLDSRRLTAKQQRSQVDEVAHARAAAYLADGVADPRRLGTDSATGTTHFRGTVDPARLARGLPTGLAPSILAAVRRDYVAHAFVADFWIDSKGRVRRVHVAYKTGGGGRVTVDASYTDFGAPVDLKLPPAKDIQDISP